MRRASLLLFACFTVALALAQSDDSVADAAKAKAQSKTHRVWDDESIQTLQGGINVVGEAPAPKPAVPGTPKPPAPPKPSGVAFKAVTIDGDVISSDSLYGKPVLVQYWATWCPHCQADQAIVDRVALAGIPVLAVDIGETEQKVRQYLKTSPRACAIILDKDANLSNLARVKAFPTYVMIDAQGRIVGQWRGEAGAAGLRSLLNKAAINAN